MKHADNQLGLRELIAIGVGGMIGGGIFSVLGIAFTILNSLESIAAFSSVTFLLVSIGVGVANLRLRHETRAKPAIVVFGIIAMVTTIIVAGRYMWSTDRGKLMTLAALYAAVFVAEFAFSKRGLLRSKRSP